MANTKTLNRQQRKRLRQRNRVDLLYKQLMGKYEVMRQYKTLEIGVKPKLIEEIHNNPLFSEDSVYIIELALKRYTHHERYLRNALKYRVRCNLENEIVEKIDVKDIIYFDTALKAHIKRRATNLKNKREEARVKTPKKPLLTLKK